MKPVPSAKDKHQAAAAQSPTPPIKFVLYGEEVLEKQVAGSGRVGRVYLPLDWLGKKVKIIRMD